GEDLAWDVTRNVRIAEQVTAAIFVPISPRDLPTSFDVAPAFSVERSWLRDALGGELRVDYAYFGAVRDPSNQIVTPVQQQLISTALGRFRHDFGRSFSGELEAGVTEAMRANDGGARIWHPAGKAAVRYSHLYGQAELAYSHSMQPNLLVAQTFI